ncbi:MotA/TolQ/ExbB proton channel family protein [Clostridiaceae bacterium M8S5]|nr:MotA/TolQ/ExbB proton channel family protein [Clostridiaceae bacterium M8S5]
MTHLFAKLNPFAISIIAIIMIILIIAVVASIRIKGKYRKIGKELKKIKEGNESSDVLLNRIINDYKQSASRNIEQVNTQAIIEKNFSASLAKTYFAERFVKTSISLMIILGLLGTFYGLTLSIGRLVELLTDGSNIDMLSSTDSVVSGLLNSVKGMSVAFVTSLFGIGSAIIMTILKIGFDVEGEKVAMMVDVEEYLDNVVAKDYLETKESRLSIISDNLTKTFIDLSKNIENSFEHMLKTYSENSANTTKAIENASLSLYKTTEKFDQALDKFVENTRDFGEFNYNLRTNIERMNVAFANFTEDVRVSITNLSQCKDVYKQIAVSLDKIEKK